MRKLLLVLAVVALFLPGCGGGGSSSTSRAALATRIRMVQAGDQWLYSVSGQSVDSTGKTIPLSGTLSLSISMQPFNGTNVLALTNALAVSTPGTLPTSTSLVTYLRQDPTTGDIVELGDNGGGGINGETLTTPTLIYPGTWSNAVALNSTLDFGNGITQSYGLIVTGTSTVNTPIGGFNVWTVSGGTGSGITYEWAPQLGAPVKITYQNSGISGSLTALLQSTTVPH